MSRLPVMTVLAVLLLVAAVPASASFRGTPGKVAVTSANSELQIWDPVDRTATTITSTVEPRSDGTLFGTNGRPVWSPDGLKVAFVKEVPDPGDFSFAESGDPRVDTHTAIFVYDLETGALRQVTEPPPGQKIEPVEGGGVRGHVVADFAPAWDAQGTTIGFTRNILSMGEQDAFFDQRGQNLWTTPATGGGATQITHYTEANTGQVLANVGVPEKGGFITLVASFPDGAEAQQHALKREGGSGRGGVLATQPNTLQAVIGDFDVSPDGTKLVYTIAPLFPSGSTEKILVPLDSTDPDKSLGQSPGTFVRFSNTGTGILRWGCSDHGPPVCGMAEQPLDDPKADIRPGETPRLVNTSPDVGPTGAGAITGIDVQAQELPVIYIPGFLGSEIACGPTRIWPIGIDLPRIALNAAGTGTPRCPSAGPTGSLVDSVAGKDIYKSAMTFMTNRFQDRATLFAWDWRKSPQSSLLALNDAIGQALAKPGLGQRQGVKRVAIVAHSYGGLLTRAYLEQQPQKVARVLTLGTPYWGSPKAIFPLALGVETPVNEIGLDFFIDNDDMQLFARNLAGNYQLYPGAVFGPWLSLSGQQQNAAGVSSYVASRKGNAALLAAARADHQRIYDAFYDNSSLIDYRAVSGTGLATMGEVGLKLRKGDLVDVTIGWTNGDGTVPAKSAGQGPIGVFPPRGDPVHVQHTKNIDHVALGGAPSVMDAYADFLDFGAVPRKLGGPGLFAGLEAEFTGLTAPQVSVHPRARAAAGHTLTPQEAARAGLAQVVQIGRKVIVKTDTAVPVTLSVRGRGKLRVTPIGATGKAKTRRYRLPGKRVRITPATKPGAAPAVRRGSKRLAPIRTKKKRRRD